jgi:IS5 family transposase
MSIMFPTIVTNLETSSPTMVIMGKRTKPQHLEDVTMFYRMVLTSSSGLRINHCRSCWKEDSKSYSSGMKTQIKEQVWFFYPIKITMSKSKHGFSTITSRKSYRLRDPRDEKSGRVSSLLCSPRSELTWQHPHQLREWKAKTTVIYGLRE